MATKEPLTQMYERLKKHIHHAHIKDVTIIKGTPQYRLLGKGDSPIFEAVDALIKDGYNGYYSFEWEKLWHSEIEKPELALAHYPKVMQQHFKKNI